MFYVLALVILLIGIFGLFGQEKDPLSAVYLVPLGLPWLLFVDWLPEVLLPSVGVLAPVLNLAILMFLCRLRNGRRKSG
ncbi:hypothetical protein [Primorskyibacter sp. 2E233]|uniref:hypothetical protein n=1 Tax=Primorskyibacter sp. 2E233 TaxID=3413431 RepID=UPI003BF2F801